MLKENTKNLINLFKDLINIDYKEISTKNVIDTHQYNLNIQKETYNQLISFLNDLLNKIKNIENISDYYDDLIKLSTTNNKIPTLEELNISNYTSLQSININKNLTIEINKFYREINEIIDNIQKSKEKEAERINKIKSINKKIEELNEKKHNKLIEIKNEKIRIEKEIEQTQEELNKTFIFNIFKRDSLKAKIDLLNQEYIQYEENTEKLNKDITNKINKEQLKIEELKKDL